MQEFKYSDLIKPTQSWTFRGKEELLTDNKTFFTTKKKQTKNKQIFIYSVCVNGWVQVLFDHWRRDALTGVLYSVIPDTKSHRLQCFTSSTSLAPCSSPYTLEVGETGKNVECTEYFSLSECKELITLSDIRLLFGFLVLRKSFALMCTWHF